MDRNVEAVICIPSYRRPEGLKRTLDSLQAQVTDIAYAVVVIDNDGAGREAVAVAQAFFTETGIEGKVAVENAQGNCHAINTAFSLARTHYAQARHFLMIDDDEAAPPNWLAEMVATADRYGADIVGGPVHRVFEGQVGASIRSHPLFGSIDAPTGPVPLIHGSGNCLIARHVFERLDRPSFDLRYNFLGGGDMDFFTRCRSAGFRFAWCAEAALTEFVAADRVSARWLMARSIRTGTINYTIDAARVRTRLDRGLLLAKNAVSLGLSIVRMAGTLVRTGQPLAATHPPLMSVGRIMGSFGMVPSPYKGDVSARRPRHA